MYWTAESRESKHFNKQQSKQEHFCLELLFIKAVNFLVFILKGTAEEVISRDPPIKNPSNKVMDKKVFDENIRKKSEIHQSPLKKTY